MNRGIEGHSVRETEGQKDRETGAWETGRERQGDRGTEGQDDRGAGEKKAKIKMDKGDRRTGSIERQGT
jgi:hypothetical protein